MGDDLEVCSESCQLDQTANTLLQVLDEAIQSWPPIGRCEQTLSPVRSLVLGHQYIVGGPFYEDSGKWVYSAESYILDDSGSCRGMLVGFINSRNGLYYAIPDSNIPAKLLLKYSLKEVRVVSEPRF